MDFLYALHKSVCLKVNKELAYNSSLRLLVLYNTLPKSVLNSDGYETVMLITPLESPTLPGLSTSQPIAVSGLLFSCVRMTVILPL